MDGEECPQGQAALHHMAGWTALSFWDRTVDERAACNSTFVVDAVHTFDEVVALSKVAFPEVWARLPFPVVNVGVFTRQPRDERLHKRRMTWLGAL